MCPRLLNSNRHTDGQWDMAKLIDALLWTRQNLCILAPEDISHQNIFIYSISQLIFVTDGEIVCLLLGGNLIID